MKTVGVIAEYNPFHTGHRYQLQQINKQLGDCRIVAVMSGSITQRGELTLLDKWQRARAAVLNGADLVLELPAVFAVQSAEGFAWGGVELLNRIGGADYLAFGTQGTDCSTVRHLAEAMEAESVKAALREGLDSGKSYAAAMEAAVRQELGISGEVLREPNTILGIEYLRALKKTGAAMEPMIIPRQGAGHNEAAPGADGFSSGTAIRSSVMRGNLDSIAAAVPEETLGQLKELDEKNICDINRLFMMLLYELQMLNKKQLADIYTMGEGLENALLSKAFDAQNYNRLISLLQTKRYAATRLQRLLMYVLLRLSQERVESFFDEGPLYARVLAFSSGGQGLLREIKDRGRVPVIVKLADYLKSRDMRGGCLSPIQEMLAQDVLAANLRQLAMKSPELYSDFFRTPFSVRIHL